MDANNDVGRRLVFVDSPVVVSGVTESLILDIVCLAFGGLAADAAGGKD